MKAKEAWEVAKLNEFYSLENILGGIKANAECGLFKITLTFEDGYKLPTKVFLQLQNRGYNVTEPSENIVVISWDIL